MPEALSLNDLSSAGFTDTELQDYAQKESSDLTGAGFSQEEVNNYFGIKKPDATKMVEFWRDGINDLVSPEDLEKLNDPNIDPATYSEIADRIKLSVWGKDGNLEPIWRSKLGDSTVNAMLNIHSGGKYGAEMNVPLPEGMGFGQKLAAEALGLGFEIPGYVGSTALAGGNMFVGVAGWGTIRAMYADMRQNGQVQNQSEFWSLLGESLSQGVKEGIMISAGSAAAGVAGAFGGGTIANTVAFSSAMTSAALLMGDDMPDPESFLIQTILGLPAGRYYVKKNIDKVTNETGLHQSQLLEKAISEGDRSILENLLAVNSKGVRSLDIVFKEEVPKVEKIVVNEKIVNEPISEIRSLNVQLDNLKKETRKVYEDARVEVEKLRKKQEVIPTKKEAAAGITREQIELRNRQESVDYTNNKVKPYFERIAKLENEIKNKELQLSRTDIPKDPDAAKIFNESYVKERVVNTAFDYKKFINNFLYYGIDTNSYAAQIVKRAKELGIKNYEKEIDPYKLLTGQPGYSGIAESFVNGEGTRTGFTKGNKVNGKSLVERVGKLTTEETDLVDLLMIAKRSVYLESVEIKTGVDLTAAKNLIAKHKGSKLEKIQEDTVDYNKQIASYGLDMGFFSKEQFETYTQKGNQYVSFARVPEIGMQEAMKSGSGSGVGSGVNPLKAMKGSGDKIFSPIETTVKNTYLLLGKFEKNFATRELIDLILEIKKARPEEFSDFYKVPARVKVTRPTRKDLENAGIDTKNIPESKFEHFSIFRKEQSYLKNTEIEVVRNGKREIYEAGEELARMFRYSDHRGWNQIAKYMGGPTRLIRAGATGLNPEFSYQNVFTDSFTSPILSKHMYPPFASLLNGIAMDVKPLRKAFGLQKEFEAWGVGGGLQATIVSFDRTYNQPGFRKAFSYANPYNLATKAIDLVRLLVEKSDNLNRMGNFSLSLKKYLKDGVEESQAIRLAGYDSRINPTDFFRGGAAAKQANLVSAFFTARIGAYKTIIDAFAERPVSTFAKSVGYITTLSIYNWYTNHDDPDYKKLPQWRKDLFWNFKFEGELVKSLGIKDGYFFMPLKKPFDLGMIFGTLPERFLDYMYENDPKIITGFISRTIVDTAVSFVPLPDVLKPVLEQYSNKSLFSGRDIVPYNLEKLPSEYQFNQYTSETAKLLGKAIEKISGGDDLFNPAASPIRIDNVIRNYLVGPFGQQITKLTDKLLIESGIVDDPIRPDTPLTQIPMFRVFFVKNADKNSQHITDFYKEFKKISKINNAIENFKESGDLAEATKLQAKLPPNYTELEKAYKAMKIIDKNIRDHYNAKDLDGATKQYLIEEQTKHLVDVAGEALQRFKQKR